MDESQEKDLKGQKEKLVVKKQFVEYGGALYVRETY